MLLPQVHQVSIGYFLPICDLVGHFVGFSLNYYRINGFLLNPGRSIPLNHLHYHHHSGCHSHAICQFFNQSHLVIHHHRLRFGFLHHHYLNHFHHSSSPFNFILHQFHFRYLIYQYFPPHLIIILLYYFSAHNFPFFIFYWSLLHSASYSHQHVRLLIIPYIHLFPLPSFQFMHFFILFRLLKSHESKLSLFLLLIQYKLHHYSFHLEICVRYFFIPRPNHRYFFLRQRYLHRNQPLLFLLFLLVHFSQSNLDLYQILVQLIENPLLIQQIRQGKQHQQQLFIPSPLQLQFFLHQQIFILVFCLLSFSFSTFSSPHFLLFTWKFIVYLFCLSSFLQLFQLSLVIITPSFPIFSFFYLLSFLFFILLYRWLFIAWSFFRKFYQLILNLYFSSPLFSFISLFPLFSFIQSTLSFSPHFIRPFFLSFHLPFNPFVVIYPFSCPSFFIFPLQLFFIEPFAHFFTHSVIRKPFIRFFIFYFLPLLSIYHQLFIQGLVALFLIELEDVIFYPQAFTFLKSFYQLQHEFLLLSTCQPLQFILIVFFSPQTFYFSCLCLPSLWFLFLVLIVSQLYVLQPRLQPLTQTLKFVIDYFLGYSVTIAQSLQFILWIYQLFTMFSQFFLPSQACPPQSQTLLNLSSQNPFFLLSLFLVNLLLCYSFSFLILFNLI